MEYFNNKYKDIIDVSVAIFLYLWKPKNGFIDAKELYALLTMFIFFFSNSLLVVSGKNPFIEVNSAIAILGVGNIALFALAIGTMAALWRMGSIKKKYELHELIRRTLLFGIAFSFIVMICFLKIEVSLNETNFKIIRFILVNLFSYEMINSFGVFMAAETLIMIMLTKILLCFFRKIRGGAVVYKRHYLYAEVWVLPMFIGTFFLLQNQVTLLKASTAL